MNIKKENEELSSAVRSLETIVMEVQESVKVEKRAKKIIEDEVSKMKRRYGELETSKNKELEK